MSYEEIIDEQIQAQHAKRDIKAIGGLFMIEFHGSINWTLFTFSPANSKSIAVGVVPHLSMEIQMDPLLR